MDGFIQSTVSKKQITKYTNGFMLCKYSTIGLFVKISVTKQFPFEAICGNFVAILH